MLRKPITAAGIVLAATIGYAGAADLPVEKAPALKPVPIAPFFLVNDNSISYSYAFTANNPGAGTTPKHVVNFTHFDVWAYGTNFFTVDWLKATNGKGPPNGAPAAPYKGFVNVGVFAYKEWQHDGFAALGLVNPSGEVSFDTTWAVEVLYVQPLGFLPQSIPLTFKSFAVIHGPKGCGEPCNPGPGLVRTTEYLTQQTLALDVGKMVGSRPNMVSVWTAYRWWKNKFGITPNQPG